MTRTKHYKHGHRWTHKRPHGGKKQQAYKKVGTMLCTLATNFPGYYSLRRADSRTSLLTIKSNNLSSLLITPVSVVVLE